MQLTDKTCRFCLTEQKVEYGQKLDDISSKNHSDTVVQAFKDVFGWQVSDNLYDLTLKQRKHDFCSFNATGQEIGSADKNLYGVQSNASGCLYFRTKSKDK